MSFLRAIGVLEKGHQLGANWNSDITANFMSSKNTKLASVDKLWGNLMAKKKVH